MARDRRGRGRMAAMLGVMLAAGHAASAQTSPRPGERTGAGQSFAIPRQPVADALAAFSAATGLQASAPTGLVAGRTSPGVSGTMPREAALAALLAGTGLAGRIEGGSVTVAQAPEPRPSPAVAGLVEVPQVDVTGARGTPPTGTIGAPPPPYAGGQVSSGARLGMLGNRDVFETPFSTTSYTARLNEDQQARSLADVVANDPAVRSILPRGSLGEQFFIRGFRVFPSDVAFDGLYGITSFRRQPIEGIEQVEILRGPSALLSGVPALGSIGGSINLIPKRAGAEDITRLTAGYVSSGQFGGQVDLGRRYGAAGEWGVRFNGAYRDGDSPVRDNQVGFGVAALGLDYRGERVRLSADLGYNRQEIEGIQNLQTVRAGFAIPGAPSGRTNSNQPWEDFRSSHYFAATRAEFDVDDSTTIYGALGWSQSDEFSLTGSPQIINARGDFLQTVTANPSYFNSSTAEIGSRSRFATGPVNHQVTTALTGLWRESGSNNFPIGTAIASNIYNPIRVPERGVPNAFRDAARSSRVENRGLAVADTFSILGDRVALTLGGRLQEVETVNFSTATGLRTSQTSRRAFSPAAALVVKPVAGLSLYGNYIEGLQAGAAAPNGTVNAGQFSDPFTSRQVEVGAKYDFGTFGVTLAAFRITQPSAFTDPARNRFVVDGEQRNQGVELSLFGAPADGLRLLGGVTYTDGELTQTAGGVNNGRTAPGVPKVLLNLYGDYDLPFQATRGLTLTGRVIHTSAQFYDQANTQRIPSWTRTDLGARYTFERPGGKPVTLRFAVENAFGVDYYASTAGGFLTQGAPRTYLASATVDFLRRPALLLLAALGLTAGASARAEVPLSAVDSRGRTVTLARPPERVVALRDGAYGQLAALGLRPVGATAYRETRADTARYFPDPGSIPALGGPTILDGEALAALRPDLIIGSGGDLPLLEAVAPVFEMGALRSIADFRANMAALGALTGRAPQAAAALARFDRRLAAYRAVAGAPLDVLLVGARDGRGVMIEAGPNCELIDAVFRCRQRRAPTGQGWVRTSLEGLLASDPEVIILSNWSGRTDAEFLDDMARTPLWAELRAVRGGRVVILDDYRFPDGLSLVKAAKFLDQMVPRLRPDVLSGPLTEAQVDALAPPPGTP